jgi:hypothetical protein
MDGNHSISAICVRPLLPLLAVRKTPLFIFGANYEPKRYDPGAKALFSFFVIGAVLTFILLVCNILEIAENHGDAGLSGANDAETLGFSFGKFSNACLWVVGIFMTLCASFLPATDSDYNHYSHDSPGTSFGYIIGNILCMYLLLLGSCWALLFSCWVLFFAAVPTCVLIIDDIRGCWSSKYQRVRRKVGKILEGPLDDSDEALLESICKRYPRYDALHHLSFFSKHHPSQGIYMLLADISRRKVRGAFQGYKKHPTQYYVCMAIIVLLVLISFYSSKKAALAVRGTAHEKPIGYFFTTRFYLKDAAIAVTAMYFRFPPTSKCATSSDKNQPSMYVSCENMLLIQRHIEHIFTDPTAPFLNTKEYTLLYELLVRLEISTQSYFSRMRLSTVISSTFMFCQTWFNVEMTVVVPSLAEHPSSESQYMHAVLALDATILLIYLGLFCFFVFFGCARSTVTSNLVNCAKSRPGALVEHQVSDTVPSTADNPNDPSTPPHHPSSGAPSVSWEYLASGHLRPCKS